MKRRRNSWEFKSDPIPDDIIKNIIDATRWVSAINTPPIERKIRALLGIPGAFMTYDMMALGTSDFQPAVKKMRALSEVIHYGQCGQKDFRTDEEVRAYFDE